MLCKPAETCISLDLWCSFPLINCPFNGKPWHPGRATNWPEGFERGRHQWLCHTVHMSFSRSFNSWGKQCRWMGNPMYEKTLISLQLLLYTVFSIPLFWMHVCSSASDTFEPCVSTKSSTTPVACGYCGEVLAVDVISEESTVCLG